MANTKSTVRTQIESLLDELHHLIESMLGDYSEESLVMRNSKGITRFFKKEKNGTYTYISASNNKEISICSEAISQGAEEGCKERNCPA